MTRSRPVLCTGPMAVLLLASAAWLSAPAAVAAPVAATPATLACGATIAQNTTLIHDLGPCPGDGLVVTGSNITVNLAGHTITGSHQVTSTPAAEQVGIHLEKASNVTVENGTVQYFDGGVAVEGGSGNTIRGIYAHDNINRDLLTNVDPSQQPLCNYGDGILTDNSDNNRIEGNRAVHNGPFAGITLLDASTNNTVTANQVTDNYVVDQTPNGGGTLCGSSAGTITGGMGSGRTVQDMGIRIEGAGATYNKVEANQATHNGLDGIAIFDYFCNLSGKMHLPPTHDNSVIGNSVSGTGDLTVQKAEGTVDSGANGIAVLSEGNGGVNCTAYNNTISANTSVGNWQDGIFIGGMPSAPGHPQATTVVGNTVDNNHLDGVGVQSGAVANRLTANSGHGNAEFDGADYNFNPSCGSDVWTANRFGTVNQLCVAHEGTGTVRQVIFNGASGTAAGLQTTWSGLVTVTNPAGFSIYSGTDSTCSAPIATGEAPVSGNGTNSPTVSLTKLPAPGNAYFQVAANSVTAGKGVGNAAVPCSPLEFTGTPTVDTVSSVTISGTLTNPVFTVAGTGFGPNPPSPDPSTPPDGQQGCPPSPNSNPQGFLYGTNLYVVDQASNGFDAGLNSVTGEFDCVGLVVQSWSNTQVVFTLGNLYDQNIPGNDYVLSNGDPVQVAVLGATGHTTVTGLS